MVLLILLGIGSYAYNQYLINNILKKERSSVELWAKAIEYNARPLHKESREELLQTVRSIRNNQNIDEQTKDAWISSILRAESDLANAELEFVANELVIKNRFEIPSVVVDEEGNVLFSRNIQESEIDQETINEFKNQNEPITIKVGDGSFTQTQYVYYGESPTVRMLRYFPYIQFTLLAILLGIGYTTYSSIRKTEQSNLWVGMAKEAAHQLGTPVSSLYGWIELLKEQNSDDQSTLNIVHELKNDVKRLQGVAERFNKIGSAPELNAKRIGPILDQVIDYMERRMPQLGKEIQLIKSINTDVKVNLNAELFQWAIENLVKNAMDAIKNTNHNAHLAIEANRIENEVIIDVKDSGNGIEKKYHKEIFKPGYSTKKRGWGLGLSLTKRIIEDYHQGQLFVQHSSADEGTTMRIVLYLDNGEEDTA